MITPSTGMGIGERYAIESPEHPHRSSGFFLDGKYYLHPDLLTAVGWLEGQRFLYDELDSLGEPVYPEKMVGTIDDLTLTMEDGSLLKLVEIEFAAEPADTSEEFCEPAEPSRSTISTTTPVMLAATAATLIFGYGIARLLTKRRQRRDEAHQ
jgi:hypothetical protein